ncbi:MAG: ribonuclease H-like domain-containing protein [Bacteroidetes bacterium]|nr:ribonuclease H-like domain-containing protein [Bacteroidota bacterium]
MLSHINLRQLIFIDIETVPQFSSFSELSPTMKELWAIKHAHFKAENETPEDGYLKRAGVYAEFAKIVCISTGFFHVDKNEKTFRLKSFFGNDEKEMLQSFVDMLRSFGNPYKFHFCGHNIREFDLPFICRRLLIHQFDLPEMIDYSGKRPWETFDVDTLQLWKFGDYKHYTSLRLLAEILDIPTPKDDIDGKDVCRVYWQEQNLPRIMEYCQKDVVTVARLLQRFKGEKQILSDEDLVVVK